VGVAERWAGLGASLIQRGALARQKRVVPGVDEDDRR
jgi:hypothetical protein